MVQAGQRSQLSGDFAPVSRNTIWRLAQYVEYLGALADGLGERQPDMNNVSDEDLAKVVGESDELRGRIRANRNGAECPYAERLLDRAADQLDIVRRSNRRNRGAWWAALGEVRAAHAVTGVEPAMLRKVFACVNFPNAQAYTKATLVPPQPGQELAVRVYNFTGEPLTGQLQATVPSDWGGGKPVALFQAPAGGCSEPVVVPYSVPDRPMPWVAKLAYRPCGDLPVNLPEPLAPNTDLWIGGQIGRVPMPTMKYRLCVGSTEADVEETMRIASR